jgi:hypothetical protein
VIKKTTIGAKILYMSRVIAKATFRKIAATRLLKIWQPFCTPPNSFIFFDHLMFAHLRKERTKKLTLVYDRGKKIRGQAKQLLKQF